MSYIGINPNTPLLNTSTQFFSGNGAVTQYTLGRAVASASDLDVFVGANAQVPGVDYVAGNTTIIFTVAPGVGSDNVAITYRGGALNTLDLTATVFNAGSVGNPSVYSLAANNTGVYWPNAQTMAVTVSGANRALFNATATSTNSTTGAITTVGGIGVGGNINTGGQINVGSTVESANIATGALTVNGGAGIVGNLNIGGDITCVGDFTVNGTFTTTGTDSLDVNDPFIFLANANPGDTYDSGVITQYYDGANTRYSGYFRDVTDGKYKLFGNLLTEPTTTVDTGNVSFAYNDLILANLSATGNVNGTYILGNGALLSGISSDQSQIFSGNSKVTFAGVNGNIIANVNNTTIAVISSTGIAVTGVASGTTLSASGNITGGNLISNGSLTAVGNINSTVGNLSMGNVISAGVVSATSNITGGNLITAGLITGGNIGTGGIVTAAGNVTGGNINTTGILTVGSTVSATGNITGNFFLGNGSQLTGIDATSIQSGTSNVRVVSSGGNVAVSVGGVSNIAVFDTTGEFVTGLISVTGNVTGGNIITSALIQGATLSATGAVTFSTTTGTIGLGTSQTTGTTTIGGATQTGFIQVGRSTLNQGIFIGNGVTASANTKTLSIGENGGAGSTTTIGIGAALGAGSATFNAATPVTIANTGGSALSVAGNITGANISTSGASGNITGANVVSATTFTGTTVSATGNVTGGNIITAGVVIAAAGTISASGTVTGGNLVTNGFITAGQYVSATGNVTGGNINTAGLVSSTGNITNGIANVLTGNAIVTTLVQAARVSATGNVNATGNISGGNIAITGNASAATAAADTNTTQLATTAYVIGQASATTPTSIGTNTVGTSTRYARADHTHTGVTSVNGSSGAVTGIATTAGNLAQFAATTSSQLAGVISDETGTGNLVFANTPTLVTPVIGAATGTSLSVSGNVTTAGIALGTGNLVGGNITATHFGSGAGLTSLTGANVTGTVASATTAGTVTTAAQGNITSVGTLTTLTVSGTITGSDITTSRAAAPTQGYYYFGNTNAKYIGYDGSQFIIVGMGTVSTNNTNLTVGTATVTLGNITNANGNGVGNIGATGGFFNTVFAKATSAQYADLAENYSADADYAPGTVLSFGGTYEVTLSTESADSRVAGIVSTHPAHLMNSTLEAEHVAALALTGRVPALVVGTVRKGDMMVSAGNGHAQACATPAMGTVIGKALENFDGSQGIIEIVVGRM
jgi:hypothetical protein